MQDNSILNYIDDAFKSIGYKDALIKKDYRYADLFSSEVSVRIVDRAIFGQEPLDYRSACFGVQVAESGRSSIDLARELKALGAPQVFILNNGTTERWAITELEPVLREEYKTINLSNIIIKNTKEWNPKAVIRAKSNFSKPAPQQMDFADIGLLPTLDSEASRKIDYLLRTILNVTEREFKDNRINFDPKTIFQAIFSLLAAKLLKDRDVANADDIDFSWPETALKAVSDHYGSASPFSASKIPMAVLKTISQRIGESFSLQNISVDTLTYIYENTFVSAESRKKLGIHSTPSYVADYVLSQIPIEELPRDQWHTADPMSGHGIFLIAAMRRMRNLLPENWDGRERHKFYIDHLRGLEIDPFSVEVARMCLMLADFPEPNGWNLKNVDAFAGKILEDTVSDTMVLIGNPPFENIENRSPDTPKPAELLRRVLPALPVQALIGLVLPRSFLDGDDYRKQREMILRDFELIALTGLPDGIFSHSDMETAIMVARKRQPGRVLGVSYREVKDQDREAFLTRHRVTWEDHVPQAYFKDKMNGRIVVPLLREIWTYLGALKKLGDVSDIRIGVQYEPSLVKVSLKEIIQSKPFPGSTPAIWKITDGFEQFIAKDTVYISTDKGLRRKRAQGAWDLDWKKPKVVIPASRTSRGPWRYAAAIDTQGRFVNRGFYAVWPKIEQLNVEILAALLNSPVAAAFVYAHSFQRTIAKRAYQDIPIPEISSSAKYKISSLVRHYLEAAHNKDGDKDLLLQIDAEVLKLYKLPGKFESQLLRIFWGYQRPVPFEFTGYIPIDIDSWIPLHIYISDGFRETTPQKIMERIPMIHNAEFLDYLKHLGDDDE